MGSIPPGAVGIFGKVPAQGDYLRAGALGSAARALDGWFAQGLDALKRGGGKLLSARFLFRCAESKDVLVGAFVPSRDAVGREFPLTVVATFGAGELVPGFAALPVGFDGFFEGAEALLAGAPSKKALELTDALRGVALPAATELGLSMAGLRARFGALSATALLDEGGLVGDVRAYALATFAAACQSARGTAAGKAAVVLDCPARSPEMVCAWLDLARRLGGFSDAPPSAFWTSDRLLLGLGVASSAIVASLARPDAPPQQIWPLHTKSADAAARARQSLSPTLRRVLDDPGATVDAVLVAAGGA